MAFALTIMDLESALAKPGCPVCTVGRKTTDHYLFSFLWESVNDVGTRMRMLDDMGFCPQHTRLLAAKEKEMWGNLLGVNIVYEHLSRELTDQVRNWRKRERRWRTLKRLWERLLNRWGLSPFPSETPFQSGECFLCGLESRHGRIVLSALYEEIERRSEKILEPYAKSDGLCLHHFQIGLASCSRRYPYAADWLLEDFLKRLELQQRRMREYLRKYDWNNRSEKISDDEYRAWRQALSSFTGYPPASF